MQHAAHRSKHRTPTVAVVCYVPVQSSGLLVLRPEAKRAKPRGLVLRECGVVPQYITKTLCSIQGSHQRGKLDGVCSTSCTSMKFPNPNSIGMYGALRCFGLKTWTSSRRGLEHEGTSACLDFRDCHCRLQSDDSLSSSSSSTSSSSP